MNDPYDMNMSASVGGGYYDAGYAEGYGSWNQGIVGGINYAFCSVVCCVVCVVCWVCRFLFHESCLC